MSLVKYCPRCGNIGGGVQTCCSFCGYEIFETKYTFNDMIKTKDFREKILEEYAKNSPEFDEELCNKRIKEEDDTIHGKGANVNTQQNDIIKCPKCGSTAVSTGARGFSIVTGFLGSGQTVNRCGNCGYKWKPKG